MLSIAARRAARLSTVSSRPSSIAWSRCKSTSSSSSTSSTSVPVKETVALKPIRKVQTDPEERDYHAAVVNGRGLLTPYQHPAPYGIPVASIHFRSHWPHLLLQSTHFAQHAAASLGIPVSGVAMLPTKRTLWTVLRGPFAHKKSQENFERRIHKRAIKAYDADPEVVDRWIKYLERHSMAGVGMRIVRWHRVPVGVGKEQLESVVGQMRLQLEDTTGKDKLQDLVAQIIAQETKAAQGAPKESKVVSSS
ncbi:ribosomal protein S10 domain-containing protein [Amylostereum chailletii]|nr:ribosomal protein S10 domain-containing protein [Amylostereum chailletii]